MYTQHRDPHTPSLRTANTLEVFDKALPDFLSLYGVAAITRQSALLAITPHKIGTLHSGSFQISGQINGVVKVLIPRELFFSIDLITEAANIVLGHLVTKIEADNLKCSLSMNLDNADTDSEFSFAVNYRLDNGPKQNDIKFNFYLNRKVY